jgi:4-amino-4-deoxy-L-arabinose transferase-like glycosyltransferase
MNTETRRWLGLLGVVGVSAALIGLGMGRFPLLDPDEAKHAEAAREMLEAGRWFEPLVYYQPYHHKPSLFYVLVGICYRIFGVSEFAARLVPAVAAIVTIASVYLHGARRSIRPGLVAALLLLSTPLFVGVSRFANFDGLLTCLTTLVVLSFARWLDRGDGRPCPMSVYVLAGIGVLVKGPVVAAIVGVPVVLSVACLGPHGPIAKSVNLLRGSLVACLIVALWAVPAGILYPDYLYEFVWTHNLRRFWLGDADMFHPEPFWFFVPVMFVTMLPWSVLLPSAISRIRQAGLGDRFLALFAVWVVAFFSLSSGKLAPYILPAYPALALLVAGFLCRAADDPFSHGQGRRLLRGVGMLYFLAMPASVIALARHAPGFEYAALVLVPTSLFGAMIGLGRASGDGSAQAVTIRLCLATLGAYMLMLVCLGDDVGRFTSDRDLARLALKPGQPETTVVYRVRPFSYLFYLGRPIVYKRPDDVWFEAVTNPDGVLVLTKDRRVEALRALAPELHLTEVGRNYRHVLLSTRVTPGGESVPKR